jgi:hypothetical protein
VVYPTTSLLTPFQQRLRLVGRRHRRGSPRPPCRQGVEPPGTRPGGAGPWQAEHGGPWAWCKAMEGLGGRNFGDISHHFTMFIEVQPSHGDSWVHRETTRWFRNSNECFLQSSQDFKLSTWRCLRILWPWKILWWIMILTLLKCHKLE